MGQSNTNEIVFPVVPLEELYAEHGSKDNMAKEAISQLVSSLVEFGVSTFDIGHHLVEAAKKVNEEM